MVAQELLALEARRTGVAVREIDIDKSVAETRARFSDGEAARAFLVRFAVDEELFAQPRPSRSRGERPFDAHLRRRAHRRRRSRAYLAEHRDLVDDKGPRPRSSRSGATRSSAR